MRAQLWMMHTDSETSNSFPRPGSLADFLWGKFGEKLSWYWSPVIGKCWSWVMHAQLWAAGQTPTSVYGTGHPWRAEWILCVLNFSSNDYLWVVQVGRLALKIRVKIWYGSWVKIWQSFLLLWSETLCYLLNYFLSGPRVFCISSPLCFDKWMSGGRDKIISFQKPFVRRQCSLGYSRIPTCRCNGLKDLQNNTSRV